MDEDLHASDQFREAELAWWRHVEAACPHPVNSRFRYSWIRENPTFSFRGDEYERQVKPLCDADRRRTGASEVWFVCTTDPNKRIFGVLSGAPRRASGSSAKVDFAV